MPKYPNEFVKANAHALAFPTVGSPIENVGLSKREWLTGLAMQGMLCNTTTSEAHHVSIAKWSVDCADQVLIALEQI